MMQNISNYSLNIPFHQQTNSQINAPQNTHGNTIAARITDAGNRIPAPGKKKHKSVINGPLKHHPHASQ